MFLRDHKRRTLTRLMERRGISQRELAKAAGYKSHSHMGRLMRGDDDTIDTDPALRIAHYLDLPVEALFSQTRAVPRPRRKSRAVA